jgi:membrane-bound lytic murein transglycosylase B
LIRFALQRLSAALVAGASIAAAVSAPPPPNAAIPRDPGRLARTLTETDAALRAAIDAWTSRGANRGPVMLYALYEQRIYLLLAQRPALSRRTIPRLSPRLARDARTNVVAKRELWRITPTSRLRRFKTGASLPAPVLLRYYREAERRFKISRHVLAAINFVESSFNKLRNSSAAGAQGPMQFMPATWRAYGMGGNVHDPHDAIMGAANYLRANGAPQNYRRALYRYNPSPLYVDAILRYAARTKRDRHAFYEYYSWQVFVRTPSGLRRLTGPR